MNNSVTNPRTKIKLEIAQNEKGEKIAKPVCAWSKRLCKKIGQDYLNPFHCKLLELRGYEIEYLKEREEKFNFYYRG
jgi:hypothetical protein